MGSDIGFLIGAGIIMLFGAIIAFGIPHLLKQEGEEQAGKEVFRAMKWIRFLGIILMAVSFGMVVVMLST